MSKKRIKLFEYDEAWVYCVLNDIKDFQIVKQEKRKYSIFMKNNKKWVKE